MAILDSTFLEWAVDSRLPTPDSRLLLWSSPVQPNRHKCEHYIRQPGRNKRVQVALGSKYGGKTVGNDENGGDHDADGQVHSAAAPGFAAGDHSPDHGQ